jgi:DNA-directed RNA polymerase specialized sigma24 family protein
MYERLRSAQKGNPADLEWARQRYIPGSRRWFRARLPKYLLRSVDVDRCVADAFEEALQTIDPLGSWEGAFQLSLRNNLQTKIRHLEGELSTLDTETADELQSPLQEAVGLSGCRSYESALGNMSDSNRHAVVARIEFGFGYHELAEMLGQPTPEAARAVVVEAVNKLAEAMCDEH